MRQSVSLIDCRNPSRLRHQINSERTSDTMNNNTPSSTVRRLPGTLEAKKAAIAKRQWLRLPQVLDKTQTGKTWLYARMNDEIDPFPPAIKLSARCVVWDESQVDAWMERQADKLAKPADLVDQAQADA